MNQARGPRNTKGVILTNNEECVLCLLLPLGPKVIVYFSNSSLQEFDPQTYGAGEILYYCRIVVWSYGCNGTVSSR